MTAIGRALTTAWYWIILFPVPQLGLLNAKRIVRVDLRCTPEQERLAYWRGLRLAAYRVWFRPFKTCFWPYILVDDEGDDGFEILSIRLLNHEYRHFLQMAWGGLVIACVMNAALVMLAGSWWWCLISPGLWWLVSYGLCFVALLPVKLITKGTRSAWYRAYYAIPWELDARAYANRKSVEP